jgi:hypothetical protein
MNPLGMTASYAQSVTSNAVRGLLFAGRSSIQTMFTLTQLKTYRFANSPFRKSICGIGLGSVP